MRARRGLVVPPVLAAVAALTAAMLAVAVPSLAQPPSERDGRAVVDRVAVRFYAPETGGANKPRFITERVLAFEAHLDALSEETIGEGAAEGARLEERHLRSALDRHVAEEILAALQEDGERGPAEPIRLAREARADVEQRAGGAGPVRAAADEEGLDPVEVDAVFLRRGRAAAYLEHAVTRFLHPGEEQVREVYRTNPHPFRARPYEEIHTELARWFVFERLKAIEGTFLQTARSRIAVVIVPR